MQAQLGQEVLPRQAPIETPIEDREILVLAIALVAFIYALATLRGRTAPRAGRLLQLALAMLVVGLVATNVESYFRGGAALAFNLVEHASYLGHTLLLIAYLWGRRGARTP